MGVVMSQSYLARNPISQMNRQQRRRHMRELGYTWAQARVIAKRKEEMDAQEARLAAMASRLTPVQARRALAEWAARGGDPPKSATVEWSEPQDPTNFNVVLPGGK